jgi:hypothetical protein
MKMRLLGFVPIGWEEIVVTDIEKDAAGQRWSFRDAGSGSLARRWDHRLIVQAWGERTRYTDRLEIEAGRLTLAAGWFGRLLFAWRHHRWRVLVRQSVRA